MVYKLEVSTDKCRPGSSFGTATGYVMDGPGVESRWARNFSHTSRPALGPTHPPVQWVPGLSLRYSGRGVVLTTHPPSSAEVKKEESYTSAPPLDLQVCYGVPYLSYRQMCSKFLNGSYEETFLNDVYSVVHLS
jgi:hypothetical protein